MQQLHVDKKHHSVTLKIDTLEDLWYLGQLIGLGDHISGRTVRKIKLETSDRNNAVTKKVVHLKILVEKVAITDTQLRVSGPVVHGTEDVSSGSYHTFGLEPGSEFTLEKKAWLGFHWEKLEEACLPTHAPILLVLHDREHAHFALLKKTGVEHLSDTKGQVTKKAHDQVGVNFFKQIAKDIVMYDERYDCESIVLASPSFFKEYTEKELDARVLKKLIRATISHVGAAGVKELLHRQEIKSALAQDRHIKEMEVVEKLYSAISREEPAAYGLASCVKAAEMGAVSLLIVTDGLIRKLHEAEEYGSLDALFNLVDSSRGAIMIISSAHDGGKKLDGLSGVGAMLRYAVDLS